MAGRNTACPSAPCTSTSGRRRSPSASARRCVSDDWIASTHRGHGHCIAKGVDVRADDGRALRQGDRHEPRQGRLDAHHRHHARACSASTRSSATGAAHAVGAGLSAKVRKTDQVVAAFFGEGAAGIGTLHEAMNMAAIWKLPVVFVCENNGYAQATPVEYAVAVENIADRAAAYGMPGEVVDGQDVRRGVRARPSAAVARARAGAGPIADRVQDLSLLRPPSGRRSRSATGRRRRSARRASAIALQRLPRARRGSTAC